MVLETPLPKIASNTRIAAVCDPRMVNNEISSASVCTASEAINNTAYAASTVRAGRFPITAPNSASGIRHRKTK